MEWPRWEPTYRAILADFGYDASADEDARDALDALLEGHAPADLDALSARVKGREAWVLGPAAARADVRRVPVDAPLFVTDAAATLVDAPMQAAAIVTDLDGDVAVQQALNAAGVPAFVHAHGDNRDALRAHVPAFYGPLTGTTQAAPKGRVQNFGGFTDGDRAACLAVHLGAARLALVGFDFDHPTPKAGRDPAMKRRKLAWARRIMEDVLDVPVRHVVSESTHA